MIGVVRYWISDRRFGKIAGSDRRLWFFHFDDLATPLEPAVGLWVEFTPVAEPRGPRARDVRLAAVEAPRPDRREPAEA